MEQISVELLGKSQIVTMKFKQTADESIAVGQWIILWNEIPARKIAAMTYEVYPECTRVEVESFEERAKSLIQDLNRSIEFIPSSSNVDFIISNKYRCTSRGTKRIHFWESPEYY